MKFKLEPNSWPEKWKREKTPETWSKIHGNSTVEVITTNASELLLCWCGFTDTQCRSVAQQKNSALCLHGRSNTLITISEQNPKRLDICLGICSLYRKLFNIGKETNLRRAQDLIKGDVLRKQIAKRQTTTFGLEMNYEEGVWVSGCLFFLRLSGRLLVGTVWVPAQHKAGKAAGPWQCPLCVSERFTLQTLHRGLSSSRNTHYREEKF